MNEVTLADIEAESERFVARLDRTLLGRFAVPASALAAMDTFQRTRMRIKSKDDGVQSNYSPALRKLMQQISIAGIPEETISTELFFWWSISDEYRLAERAAVVGKRFSDGIDRLFVVYAHPEMYGFFHADIWDMDFIGRCIADGIDSEIAASMHGLTGGLR